MPNFTYDALILSAGESSRMGGFPKALLDFSGKTFIENIADNIKSINIMPRNIIIVLGYHADKIIRQANIPGCTIAINPDPSRGMLSSIITGLDNTSAASSGVLMTLTDHPAVLKETYNTIAAQAASNPANIIIPTYNGRKGHPVFFPKAIFEDIRTAPQTEGARWATRKNSDMIITVPVNDIGILKDIDTPEDYKNISMS